MKIIIVGAGQVGTSVAENLVNEANDITVIDLDSRRLEELQNRLDLRTVYGNGAHPDTLRAAGAEDADLILAVSNSDEINMVSCQIAYSLFHTPTKIARIRATEYLSHPEIFVQQAIPIDVIISPEQIVTDYILRLIEYPTALQVLDFAGGLVQLVGVRALTDGPLVGHEIRELADHLPNVDSRVAAIYRQDRPIPPEGNTVIEANDEVFFIAAKKHLRSVMAELRRLERGVRRVMLAGGGNIGLRLAERLEKGGYSVKLIDHNPDRTREVAERLHKTVVLMGDAADEELLIQEGIEDTDVFCALTNDDEANILSAMLAKRLGAHKVMSLINRGSYVDLVQNVGSMDIAISPQQATIGSLLAHVRRGDVVAVHSLRRGAAEAIEAVAHGDPSTSRVVGRAIGEIKLPPGVTVGAIVRGSEVLMAHHDTVIEPDDHVILFVVDKRHIPDVERMFQVAFSFL